MLQVQMVPSPAGVIAAFKCQCDMCEATYAGWEVLEDAVALHDNELYHLAKAYLVDMCFNFDAQGVPTCSDCYVGVFPIIGAEWLTEARNIGTA